jgi:glucose repression regulatory protein TUP1
MEHHQVQGMRQGSISHHPMHHPEHIQPSARAPIRHPTNSHAGPSAFGEIDPDSVATQYKKEGDNWFAIFNPKVPRNLNVDLVHTLDHDSVVCCVRFSHDGNLLATGCNRTAQIYDVSSARKLYELVDDSVKEDNLYIRAVCFSPDGKFLATGGEDHKIRIWDIQAKRVCSMFTGHTSDIYSLEFSNNGRLLVSGSGDKSVRVWDMESNQLKSKFIIESTNIKDPGVTCVAISPDSRYIAAGSLDKFVRVWDVQQDRILNIFEGHKDGVYSVAFSPDGKIYLMLN